MTSVMIPNFIHCLFKLYNLIHIAFLQDFTQSEYIKCTVFKDVIHGKSEFTFWFKITFFKDVHAQDQFVEIY